MGKGTLLVLPACPFYVDKVWASKAEALGRVKISYFVIA